MKRRLLKYFLLIMLLQAAGSSYSQQIRAVPDSVATRMQNDKEFKYANDPSFWQKEKRNDNTAFFRMFLFLSQSPWVKWLAYILLSAGVVYAAYQVMVVNNFFIFSRTARNGKNESEAGYDGMEGDIDERINAAIAAREYRLAIRYFYLKTLKTLSDRNQITLNAKSTNYDYIRQMQPHANVNDFRKLTGIYEYVWYGEFKPDAVQFEMIQRNFNEFNEHI